MDGKIPVKNRKRITIGAIAAAVVVLLTSCNKSVEPPKTAKYTITVRVEGASGKFHYGVPPTSGCSSNTAPQNEGDILVCKTDTIEWKGDNGTKYELAIIAGDSALSPASISGTGTSTIATVVGSPGPHSYWVTVLDESQSPARIFHDPDPIIIIGQ
jgi:hypothetical protein